MKSRIKLALTILVLLLAVGSLSRFLNWMNLPSDLWFWSGLACGAIWRRVSLNIIVPAPTRA
ncbi:MAG TPA: hypothetical protein VJX16_19300 [Terriglobales bacterium]|nr:hypothetical protein [Terriglobales bacterium]